MFANFRIFQSAFFGFNEELFFIMQGKIEYTVSTIKEEIFWKVKYKEY